MSRPLQSTNSQTNNVLLRVTVPRRTGRRRKRGTEEPFTETTVSSEDGARPRRSARDLRRSLEDNVGRYQVEPVGMVNRTHVFRGVRLYTLLHAEHILTEQECRISCGRRRLANLPIGSVIISCRSTVCMISPLEYIYTDIADEKMKQFDINMSKGAISNVDIIPPPSYSHGDIPFNYLYVPHPQETSTY